MADKAMWLQLTPLPLRTMLYCVTPETVEVTSCEPFVLAALLVTAKFFVDSETPFEIPVVVMSSNEQKPAARSERYWNLYVVPGSRLVKACSQVNDPFWASPPNVSAHINGYTDPFVAVRRPGYVALVPNCPEISRQPHPENNTPPFL